MTLFEMLEAAFKQHVETPLNESASAGLTPPDTPQAQTGAEDGSPHD